MKIDLTWNKEFAIKREGVVLHDNGNHKLYKCPADKWTIGHGWNIEDRGLPDNVIGEIINYHSANTEKSMDNDYVIIKSFDIKVHGIDDSAAKKLLKIALTESQNECVHNIRGWSKCNFARKSVLIDMNFNMGWGKLSGFKNMLAAIQDEDWEEAAAQMKDSRWYDQVGLRSKVLEKMMLSGEYPE